MCSTLHPTPRLARDALVVRPCGFCLFIIMLSYPHSLNPTCSAPPSHRRWFVALRSGCARPSASYIVLMRLVQHDTATYLESIRASSPSTRSDAFAVFASKTKWLSQCGQYSSLPSLASVPPEQFAVYSRVLKLACIFPKSLLALLAYEDHVKRLHERVVTLLLVAFRAVEPFLACLFSAFMLHPYSQQTYSTASGWRLGR
jgi:hypothetical protein